MILSEIQPLDRDSWGCSTRNGVQNINFQLDRFRTSKFRSSSTIHFLIRITYTVRRVSDRWKSNNIIKWECNGEGRSLSLLLLSQRLPQLQPLLGDLDVLPNQLVPLIAPSKRQPLWFARFCKSSQMFLNFSVERLGKYVVHRFKKYQSFRRASEAPKFTLRNARLRNPILDTLWFALGLDNFLLLFLRLSLQFHRHQFQIVNHRLTW